MYMNDVALLVEYVGDAQSTTEAIYKLIREAEGLDCDLRFNLVAKLEGVLGNLARVQDVLRHDLAR